jgi:hypothetical protein
MLRVLRQSDNDAGVRTAEGRMRSRRTAGRPRLLSPAEIMAAYEAVPFLDEFEYRVGNGVLVEEHVKT